MRRSADTPLRAHNNQSAFRAIGGRTSCNLNHFGRWQTLRSDGSCPLSGVKRTLRRPLAGSISDLTARPDVSFNKLTSCWGGDFVASLWTAPISARADQAVAYDDDGYIIQWVRSFIPSNTLAVVNALAIDAAVRQVLGVNVTIDIIVIDETNSRVKVKDILARFRKANGFGLVGLVGVQSNQFPRAVDIARPLRAAGIPVLIGGFHVSGCLAMLPELPADLREALDLGICLFAGEAEDRFDSIVQDAAIGRLKPIYNYLNELPPLESSPIPFLSSQHLVRTFGKHTSFDAGRGCPYQCSFCTIINVQGRKSRGRSADDIEQVLRKNLAQGVSRFFITDDNFARHEDWESIFDRIIELREKENINAHLTIPGVITYAGYILGFPNDTVESIREDIEIIKKELALDVLEFFCLTPLPGSEDHQILHKRGVEMDADMNRYDAEHVVTAHPRMSRHEWQSVYRQAWDTYYTPEHLETLMRRAAATNTGLARMQSILLMFSSAVAIENVHPLQCGIFRLKFRKDRRANLQIEPVWVFYPKYLWEIVSKHTRLLQRWLLLRRITARVRKTSRSGVYTDLALTAVNDEAADMLELFTHTRSARTEVERIRKITRLTYSPDMVVDSFRR